MELLSIGPLDGGPEQLQQEMAAAGARLSGPKLGIVYLPIDIDHGAYLRAARHGLGGEIVGATTGGAAFTERGYTRSGVVAAVLGGEGFGYTVSVAQGLSGDISTSVRQAAGKLIEAARKDLLPSQSVVTLSDAFSCDGERLLEALQASTPPHWHHFGGSAGDDWQFDKPKVFAGDEILSDAAILLGLRTDTHPSLAVRHGWTPVADSRELNVTEIDGRRVYRLDDRPAAEVYAEELVRLGIIERGDNPLTATRSCELGAKTVYGELMVRAPTVVHEDGSLQLAGGLPPGSVVRVVTATPEDLIDSASALAKQVLTPMGTRPSHGALVFDCAARLHLLGDRYGEQTRAFQGGRNFPMVGIACYGELAKFAGSLEGYHNATAVMGAW